MEGIRKTIADRMVLSKRTAPNVTITMEADTSNLQMYRKMIMAQEDIRISYTDIIVKIVANCLEKHPIINSTIEGNVIKVIKNINIGVAVATERGLIVPVIKNANEKTIEEISLSAKEKINRTRGGNINFEDITGGTFTVSNLGMFDVEIFTPIINPPESAILGLGKIIEKPVSVNKKIIIKPMMQLSLTHDHRSIDGDVAAKFLRDVKDLIENPMEFLPKIEEEIEEKIPPIPNADADVIIMGAGPGGHDAAIRASQLGKSVIIIEKDKFGGTCVNRGCIPTKILFKEAELANLIKKSEERDFGVQINDYNISLQRILSRKNNITNLLSEAIERKLSGLEIKLVKGTASFIDKNTIKVIKSDSSTSIFRAPAIFIATGFKISKNSFSNIEDNEILNTDEFLELNKLPSSIVIIGGNYIALEFASILNEMGVQVHIINLEERILIDEDAEIVDMLKQALEMEDIEIYNNINIDEINISKNNNGKKIIKFSQGNETIEIKSEIILDTIKRKTTLDDLNIKEIKIELEGDYIKTDRNMKTNIIGIYAIGDINGKYMFSHVATREGIVAAEHFANFDKRTKMSYHSIPRSYFTFPEVAFVGLSEKQAREKYTNIDVIRYPIAYTAMPRIVEQPEGMIKIIIQKDRRTIVGVGIIGKNATELIAEFSLMVNNKLNIDKISDTLHSHPTFSESIKESIWQIFTS
jgi:dihydrolipoamide dehydrogenase